APGGANDGGKGPEGPANPLLSLLRRENVAIAPPPLQRPSHPAMCLGTLGRMQAVVLLRVRLSSLPCARRNGRASASLTARGGGLSIGVKQRIVQAAVTVHRSLRLLIVFFF